jgi:hypothetical protein
MPPFAIKVNTIVDKEYLVKLMLLKKVLASDKYKYTMRRSALLIPFLEQAWWGGDFCFSGHHLTFFKGARKASA